MGSRKTLVNPKHSGKPCPIALEVVTQCNLQSCEPDPIDCKVSEWEEWSGCNKCGGSRKRFRHISRFPKYGGKQCPDIAIEEVGVCNRSCHPTTYCTWQDWGDWSQCPAKCGAAKKSRKRHLISTYTKQVVRATGRKRHLLDTYGERLQRTQQLQDKRNRIHELAVAFACG